MNTNHSLLLWSACLIIETWIPAMIGFQRYVS